jgi:hypothetical protein
VAYSNNQIVDYDGNQKIYITGTNSIKDLVINDLTLPLGVIHYTDRYKQSYQMFDSSKDKVITMISHSLVSSIAHHIILENEHLNGRLYSTPSLAIPHDRIEYFSNYGGPIAIFNLDRTLYKTVFR